MYYEDLYPLISFLPRYANGEQGPEVDKLPLWQEVDEQYARKPDEPATELGRERSGTSDGTTSNTFDPEKALPRVVSERPLKPARNPPEASVLDYIPLLRLFRWIGRKITNTAHPKRVGKKRAYNDFVESHIPLEIILVLSKYVTLVARQVFRLHMIFPIATQLVGSLCRLCSTFLTLKSRVHAQWTPPAGYCDWCYYQSFHPAGHSLELGTHLQHALALRLPGPSAHVSMVCRDQLL